MERTMEEIRFTRSMAGVPTPAGRRGAVRAAGAAAMALLATLGHSEASATRKKRRKRRKKGGSPGPTIASVVVQGASSAVLPVAAGSLVGSQASCDGPGKVLGGGYIVNGPAGTQVNVVVVESAPDAEAETFFASLYRTAEAGSVAGATIVAYALCIP
jgi:hypothetical protein